MTAMRALRVVRVLWRVAWCAAAVCAACVCAAAGVTTEPALPLLDVAFCATPASASVSGAALFVSALANCSTTLAEASGTCGVSGQYAFTVTSASLGVTFDSPVLAVPATYWCVRNGDGTATREAALEMSVMQTTPMFFYTTGDNTLTFNDATPVGTTVGFYFDLGCALMVPTTPAVVLNSSRIITIKFDATSIYICAAVPSSVSGETGAMALRNTIVGAQAYTITPTTGVRHATATISTGMNSINYAALSSSSTCSDLPIPSIPQLKSGTTVAFKITATSGQYYFCGATASKVYVPSSSTFTVVEYGVQPHSTYAGQSTPVTLSLGAAAAPSMAVALFSAADCSGTAVQAWSSGSVAWTVATRGTYYACVRDTAAPETAYYANAFVVAAMPTIAAATRDAVLGFPLAVSLRGSVVAGAVYVVGLGAASDACGSLLARANMTSTAATASLAVPTGTAATTFTYCVSNPITVNASDSSEATSVRYYSAGTVVARQFLLGYDALRAGTATAIALDSGAALAEGTTVSFVQTSSLSPSGMRGGCDAATGGTTATEVACTVASGNLLADVTFPRAGTWVACALVGDASVVLRGLAVYSATATLSVGVLLVGAQMEVRVTDIPDAAAVTLVSGVGCAAASSSSLASAVVATSSWSTNGYAVLRVTASAAETLVVCVAYPSASASTTAATAATVLSAGTVGAARAAAYPSIAYSGETTVLRFAGIGTASLEGYVARLVRGDGCGSAATAAAASVAVAGPAGDAQGVSHATLPTSALTSGAVYAVCVGASSGTAYSSAGVVAVTAAPTLSTDTQPVGEVARGLPVHVTLPRDFVATTGVDVYVVVDGATECTADVARGTVYARGSIDAASLTAAAFVAPATTTSDAATLRVCVGARANLVNDTLGYALAGTLTATRFHTATTVAQLERTNALSGVPLSTASAAELLLAGCTGSSCDADEADSTCATTKLVYTSATTVLTGTTAGTYLMCQRVVVDSATYVVGSNTTVSVVPPYVLAASVSVLQAYVPFTATMSGGPAGALSGVRHVVVQPASTACGSAAAESQSFSITGGSGTITITDVTAGQDVVLCLTDAALGSVAVLTAYLQYYVTPPAVIADAATTLTPATSTSGAYAKLSSTADCSGAVTGGSAQALVGGQATFTVAACDTTTSALAAVYYCEAASSSAAYASRGAIGVLRASNCSGGQPASIAMAYVAPGTALRSYGLASKYLTQPRLSASAECTDLVDSRVATTGYAPGVDEAAVFYVCAQVVDDAALLFTTAIPTLTVLNWAVSPTAALSRYNLTMGVLPSVAMTTNYATPSTNTFFSTSSTCAESIAGSASALGTAGGVAAYRTVGVNGLVYVCTTNPLTTSTIAVARFLSVTPPTLVSATPAIVIGAPYTARVVVQGTSPLYSMVQGADAAYTYSRYYTSSNRSVFLSSDECASALGGVVASAAADGSVTFATYAISIAVTRLTLCAGTPAGIGAVLSKVAVVAGNVYPTTLVSGVAAAPIFVPLYASTAFQLSQSSDDCSATAGMPAFTTDAAGYGAVSLTDADGNALATGGYMLCYDSAAMAGAAVRAAATLAGDATTALEAVTLTAASHFGVRGTTFVLYVASAVELLQDLVSPYVIAGLSTTRNCTTMTTQYGAWDAVSNTTLLLNATAVPPSALYLCAAAPVNDTLVALPGPAGLRFATSSIALPSGKWDACSTHTLGQCVPPGSATASSTDVLAVVHGDCCSSARTVVGQASMQSGTCELKVDHATVLAYGADANFSLCVLSTTDEAVCTTVARDVAFNTACTPSSKSKGLSGGAVAGIVVGCVVGGLLLIALILILVCCCCAATAPVPAAQEAAPAAHEATPTSDTDTKPEDEVRDRGVAPASRERGGDASSSSAASSTDSEPYPSFGSHSDDSEFESEASSTEDSRPGVPAASRGASVGSVSYHPSTRFYDANGIEMSQRNEAVARHAADAVHVPGERSVERSRSESARREGRGGVVNPLLPLSQQAPYATSARDVPRREVDARPSHGRAERSEHCAHRSETSRLPPAHPHDEWRSASADARIAAQHRTLPAAAAAHVRSDASDNSSRASVALSRQFPPRGTSDSAHRGRTLVHADEFLWNPSYAEDREYINGTAAMAPPDVESDSRESAPVRKYTRDLNRIELFTVGSFVQFSEEYADLDKLDETTIPKATEIEKAAVVSLNQSVPKSAGEWIQVLSADPLLSESSRAYYVRRCEELKIDLQTHPSTRAAARSMNEGVTPARSLPASATPQSTPAVASTVAGEHASGDESASWSDKGSYEGWLREYTGANDLLDTPVATDRVAGSEVSSPNTRGPTTTAAEAPRQPSQPAPQIMTVMVSMFFFYEALQRQRIEEERLESFIQTIGTALVLYKRNCPPNSRWARVREKLRLRCIDLLDSFRDNPDGWLNERDKLRLSFCALCEEVNYDVPSVPLTSEAVRRFAFMRAAALRNAEWEVAETERHPSQPAPMLARAMPTEPPVAHQRTRGPEQAAQTADATWPGSRVDDRGRDNNDAARQRRLSDAGARRDAAGAVAAAPRVPRPLPRAPDARTLREEVYRPTVAEYFRLGMPFWGTHLRQFMTDLLHTTWFEPGNTRYQQASILDCLQLFEMTDEERMEVGWPGCRYGAAPVDPQAPFDMTFTPFRNMLYALRFTYPHVEGQPFDGISYGVIMQCFCICLRANYLLFLDIGLTPTDCYYAAFSMEFMVGVGENPEVVRKKVKRVAAAFQARH